MVLCGDLNGIGVGTEGGLRERGLYMKLIHFIVQQKLTQHGKATLSQLLKTNLLLANFSMRWRESGLAYS